MLLKEAVLSLLLNHPVIPLLNRRKQCSTRHGEYIYIEKLLLILTSLIDTLTLTFHSLLTRCSCHFLSVVLSYSYILCVEYNV